MTWCLVKHRVICTFKLIVLPTGAVCKVRGLALLLLVGTLWRCGDGLFFEVPPPPHGRRCTSYNAPPTSREKGCRPLITSKFLASELSFHGLKRLEIACGRSELNSVFGLEKVDLWNPIRTSAIQSKSRPMRFLGLSNHEKGAPRQEISK
jgi:hypothetical protein